MIERDRLLLGHLQDEIGNSAGIKWWLIAHGISLLKNGNAESNHRVSRASRVFGLHLMLSQGVSPAVPQYRVFSHQGPIRGATRGLRESAASRTEPPNSERQL